MYNTSKWFNAVTTDSISTELLEQIYDLSFVIKPSNQESQQIITGIKNNTVMVTSEFDNWETFYGYSESQVKIHNGHFLHQQGYKGEGIQIAVIDAGFLGVDVIENISVGAFLPFEALLPGNPSLLQFDVSSLTGVRGVRISWGTLLPDTTDGPALSVAFIDNVALHPIPEPTTRVLLGLGLIGLAVFRRR